MKQSIIGVVAIVCAFAGGSALASGFRCESPDGYSVTLHNDLYATRLPAAFVLSHEGAEPRTLLKAFGAQIRKENRVNSVQYSVNAYEMGGDKVVLQVMFKEGRESLEAGETARGTLIFVADDGQRTTTPLECERYLKHD